MFKVNLGEMSGPNDGQLQAFWWDAGVVRYVDQRCLPHELKIRTADVVDDVINAIATSAVDGERCVDLFGALGVALAHSCGDSEQAVASAVDRLRTAAGGANFCEAIVRVAHVAPSAALFEAESCLTERRNIDRAIARNASVLLPGDSTILTHGNSGALATGGSGTALGAIVAAARAGKRFHVFVSEGRPLLTGTRLSAFELRQAGVPTTLFGDSASAWIVRTANITAIIVGVITIAANGDAVGEIGTYGIALAAAQHGIPFYVAGSRATVDLLVERGDLAAPPPGVQNANPLFDVTPGHLIAAIVTEYGILRPPYDEALRTLATRPNFALLAGRGGKV